MKKQYTTPQVEIVKTTSCNMMCVSFGDGTTDTMHSRQEVLDDDDSVFPWDE